MAQTSSLTQLLDVPLSELTARVVAGELELSLDELHVVVAEQALRIEASASRSGLLEAAEALHDLSAWAAARGDDHAHVRASAKWELLGEHLTDRAARADPIGVEALLRSQSGKPRQLIALLAEAPGGSLPRAALASLLETGESHVSHILRALHDAGLVHRHQDGRAVTVTLSARGREVVAAPATRQIPTPPVELPPAAFALLEQLSPARRRQVEGRTTLAPVLDFPPVAAAGSH